MSQVPRPRSLPASRHLDGMLSPYADRSLPDATLLTCDQHVSICPGCRAAADAERRLLRSLRSAATPGLSNRLESALLDLAGPRVAPAVAAAGWPSPLAVMARSAPAVYRSPIRAAVMAGLVASASAAAAWSLGLSGVGVSAASSPVAGLPASASAAAAGSTSGEASQAQAASFLSTNHFVPAPGAWAGVPGRARHSAQSIHE